MHFRTHMSDENTKAIKKMYPNADNYSCGMVEHDMHIGEFLKVLDELGIADNTIVHYSTDNGPHYNTWPDAAATPFRGEKNTNWEGGWRVPSVIRWPGVVKPGSVSNGVVHHMDWLPTYAAAAGIPESGRSGVYAASIVESFCGGLATAAFLSFLMRICQKEHAAVQYALLTAVYALAGSLVAMPSGWFAEQLDYAGYFALTAVFALPAFAFLPGARRWIGAEPTRGARQEREDAGKGA